jgi:hypothetical protein
MKRPVKSTEDRSPPPELPGINGPMKWNDFEAALTVAGFRFYWQRYDNFPDTLQIANALPSPDYQTIETDYATDISERCATHDLAASKREVAARGRQILALLEQKRERLERVLPIARLFVPSEDLPSYLRKKITIYPSYVAITQYGEEVRISDDLEVEVFFEVREHNATTGDLEAIIEKMKRLRAEYEGILEPIALEPIVREVSNASL